VDILRKDVYLVEQRGMQAVVSALELVLRRRVILVDGEYLDVAERHLSGIAALRQLLVKGCGGGTRSEPETILVSFVAVTYGIYHEVGEGMRRLAGLGIDVRPDFLVVVQDAGGKILLYQAAFVREGEMLFHIKMQDGVFVLQI
jgi:hypothetical protein